MPAAISADNTALLRNDSSGEPSATLPPKTSPPTWLSFCSLECSPRGLPGAPYPAGLCAKSSFDPGEEMKEDTANQSSPDPWALLQGGAEGQPRKGVSPPGPSTQLSFPYTHTRHQGACLPPLGPAPALEQTAALTMIEKMRGMRLRGQTGQKQEAMARIR